MWKMTIESRACGTRVRFHLQMHVPGKVVMQVHVCFRPRPSGLLAIGQWMGSTDSEAGPEMCHECKQSQEHENTGTQACRTGPSLGGKNASHT